MNSDGLISPTSAICMAKAEAIVGAGFNCDVTDVYGQFVELRLSRTIVTGERSYSVKLSRAMSVHAFQASARSYWAVLKAEHERVERAERRNV